MKNSLSITAIALLTLLFLQHASATIQAYPFDDQEKEQRFTFLIEELRCPKCQNSNLADSNAGLATDLKKIIYEKVLKGESNEQIVVFLKQRYGDFISYRPPVRPSTWLIWYGPFVLLLIGGYGVFRYVSSRLITKKIQQPQADEPVKSSSNLLMDEWESEMDTDKADKMPQITSDENHSKSE